MANDRGIQRGIQVKKSIEEQEWRVQRTGLTFGQLGVAIADEMIPNGEFISLERIGIDRFLREKIVVNVAANESAAVP